VKISAIRGWKRIIDVGFKKTKAQFLLHKNFCDAFVPFVVFFFQLYKTKNNQISKLPT
jgi:hypothetical protein